MSEFPLPAPLHDQAWLRLRARLARAAREIHFSALSDDAVRSAALLTIAGNLAKLAMSIPMTSRDGRSRDPVDAATLLATQVLQVHRPTGGTEPTG